jgi:hypothetical protein
VTQFRPVPLQIVREIWKARPMNMALDKLFMKNRRIRFDEVRTEGKRWRACQFGLRQGTVVS